MGMTARKYQFPRGFTLLELMLVLAVLVVIAAVAWPSLIGPMSNQQLTSGAEQLRAAWTNARVQAMTTGIIQVCRYETNTRHYRIEPFAGVDATEAMVPQDAFFEPGQSPLTNGQDLLLPESVVFRVGRGELDTRSDSLNQEAGAAASGWSSPIYFYPDGTTSNASVAIANDRGLFVLLVLRGLTGVVTVSDRLTAEELPQLGAMP